MSSQLDQDCDSCVVDLAMLPPAGLLEVKTVETVLLQRRLLPQVG